MMVPESYPISLPLPTSLQCVQRTLVFKSIESLDNYKNLSGFKTAHKKEAILFLQGAKAYSPNPTNKFAWASDIMLLGNKTFHWQPAPKSSPVHSDLTASVLGYVVGFKLKSLFEVYQKR